MTIIFDTNPAAWAIVQPTLSISSAIANILVFINAHLACNYTNQVAVIASHCDKAQWLYPTATPQTAPSTQKSKGHQNGHDDDEGDDGPVVRNKRARVDQHYSNGTNGAAAVTETTASNKYRPFRLIEEELIRNLKTLLNSTSPDTLQEKTSTMIAGALTLALSYINRRSQEYQESQTGVASNLADQSANQATAADSAHSLNALQSRILVITLSPSTDLAHQYIPIMNSIFACQRLNVSIDVLQLPLLSDTNQTTPRQPQPMLNASTSDGAQTVSQPHQTSTVFLQQAADATHGIFIPAILTPPSSSAPQPPETLQKIASQSLLTYLLTAFLPAPNTRPYLNAPTLISIDFRAACFCHRNVISLGYVCSICLSIFCDLSLQTLTEEGCLTCGSKLTIRDVGVGGLGKEPIVVARKKKKKTRKEGGGSNVGTPTPA